MTADVLFFNTGLDCVSSGTDITCRTPDFAIPLVNTVSAGLAAAKTSEDSVLTTGGTITGQLTCGATPQNGITDFGNWEASFEIVVPKGQQATLTVNGSINVSGAPASGDTFRVSGPQGTIVPEQFVRSLGVTSLNGGTFTLPPGETDFSISGSCAGSATSAQTHKLTLTFSVF
jgi:hypothetical protein